LGVRIGVDDSDNTAHDGRGNWLFRCSLVVVS